MNLGGFERVKRDFTGSWQKRSFRISVIIIVFLGLVSLWLLVSVGICSRRVSRSEYRDAFNSIRINMTREEVKMHLHSVAIHTRSQETYDIYEGVPLGEGYCGCSPVMTDFYKIEYKNKRVSFVELVSDTGGWSRRKTPKSPNGR
jgi:hypothetical protein